ncbi:GntR family transcriptional regulator [Macrococcus equi]|uniref:GntR family transcriptional regulator n=1 Tax=Macrococcus equi TaxID=3395462 RepID=UPI0039BE9F99
MLPKQWIENLASGERIAFDLRYRIIAGYYADGEKLSENQLAGVYEVSRSPIRDALKILASDQLIRLERMGAVIKRLSDQDIHELYDMRIMIEGFAFEKIKKQDIDRLVTELEKKLEMMRVAVKFDDAAEFAMQDILFHQTMIESIHHQQLEKLWHSIKANMLILNLIAMQQRMENDKSDFERIFKNHEMYIEAIRRQDRKLYKKVLHINFDDLNDEVDDLYYSQMKEE